MSTTQAQEYNVPKHYSIEEPNDHIKFQEDILADDLRYFLIDDYMVELKLCDSALQRIEILKKIGIYGQSLDTYRSLKKVARSDENPSVRLEALNAAELIKNKLI